jgi:hypothetical protein
VQGRILHGTKRMLGSVEGGMHRSEIYALSAVVVAILCLLGFGAVRRWLKRRFATLDWLPEYFTAAAKTMQDILWGALLPFVAWGIWFIVSNPPTWVNATAIGTALFLAGYYVWRADHVRLIPRFEVKDFCYQDTPTTDAGGHPTGRSTWVQLLPKCLTDADVETCEGHLRRILHWSNSESRWEETPMNESVMLHWSHEDIYATPNISCIRG